MLLADHTLHETGDDQADANTLCTARWVRQQHDPVPEERVFTCNVNPRIVQLPRTHLALPHSRHAPWQLYLPAFVSQIVRVGGPSVVFADIQDWGNIWKALFAAGPRVLECTESQPTSFAFACSVRGLQKATMPASDTTVQNTNSH